MIVYLLHISYYVCLTLFCNGNTEFRFSNDYFAFNNITTNANNKVIIKVKIVIYFSIRLYISILKIILTITTTALITIIIKQKVK